MLQDISKSRQAINVFTFYVDNEQSYLQPRRFLCFQANTFCHNSTIKLLQSLVLFLPALKYTSYLYLSQ